MKLTTPLAELNKIVIAGIRNAGKSSLLNNLFQKDVAIASDTPGTTTDPVTRKIELGRIGMCAVTDTAGIDDDGALGEKRIAKAREQMISSHMILFASPGHLPLTSHERELRDWLDSRNLPWLGILTFADRPVDPEKKEFFPESKQVVQNNLDPASARQLVKAIEEFDRQLEKEISPVHGLVSEQELVLLVTPQDLAAPKGRLILPQVETIRDILDRDCAALIIKERELYSFYHRLGMRPSLVITDSQAFHKVAADIPEDQPLTSFSLLFARKKADLAWFIKSLSALDNIKDKGQILVMEACSHHCQADDLARVKIPRLFRQLVGARVKFTYARQLPKDPRNIDLVIHCGGCMITRRVMMNRLEFFKTHGIPMLNFGLFLAWANGLLPRALEPFDELAPLYSDLN
ncbi:[FeFe] hydrogenase H-cluster maturation GTPase HydF [Desulforhopalus singaporensis]|uniref:[FeFe] hydrogenase H-cluster maturation GTPase HydF n=1 Tax=Desulforhopalus singaporensis TaxID=91360 RepID=A0A1H0T618_9BACT|nr:[FeFe] hydrogenase H-cluster maturation GTPase HydF [Desulforhopalus singaporensis]SDP49482.1 [FeFe] hydrogenase H-cluster maturation GTPase HydF [Desulforhopalus singaporensis]